MTTPAITPLSTSLPAEALLAELARWREAGWLRSLDTAFARFIRERDAGAPASLLLAAALVARLEGQGHSGLPLAELAADPAALLGWPPEAVAALRRIAPAEAVHGPAAWPAAWAGRPVLQIDPEDDEGRDEHGATPLVLSRGLLSLRRYWRHETQLAAQIRARVQAGPGPAADAPLDLPAARRLLDRLFGPPGDELDAQRLACAIALRGRLSIVTGGPGTGKTYTAARLLVLLQGLHAGAQPLRVALAAPTGKAAARLRQSIQQALQGLQAQLGDGWGAGPGADPASLPPARTLHALLGTQPGTRRFRHDAARPLEVDVLFVDEASMVHLEMMAALLDALPASARLVLLGDPDQLASVEAGAVLGDLCQAAAGGWRPGTVAALQALTGQALPPALQGDGPPLAQQTVRLRKSHRFDGPIGQLALAVNRGDAAAALTALQAADDGPVALRRAARAEDLLPLALQGRPVAGSAATPAPAPAPGHAAYLQALAARPAAAATDAAAHAEWARTVLQAFDGFRVLCALRDGPWGVAGLNAAIERALAEAGLLRRSGEWYEGRPVMVTRNDPALGVFNGDVGVVLRAPGAEAGLRCHFLDGEALRSVAVSRLAEVETAFAMTVHKSQGSEFGHVLLVLPDEDVPVLTRELLYTGITRARRAFTLAVPDGPANPLAAAVGRLTRRVSGLRARLS